MASRPHLLLFNPDQWRGDSLGHMGNPAASTPVLDARVSRDFVSFSRAFCQNPVCTPSRCSFMTGWYPHVRGHRTMHYMLQPDEPCLLKILKDNGYFVWWGGKNDLVPAENGFAAYCDVKYSPPAPVRPDLHSFNAWRGEPHGDNWYSFYGGQLDKGGDEIYLDSDWAYVLGAIAQIEEYSRHVDSDQPLCLYLPLSYPHPPYAVEEPFFSRIDRNALPPRIPSPREFDGKPSLLRAIAERQNLQGWSEARWDELRATYLGMCARVDYQFGLILDALRESGLYDDTAVFFFSDHGDFTGDYGLVEKTQNTFEDCLTRVPFLIKPPASTPALPRVCDALVELVDLPATVFEVAGITPEYSHFGYSLLPLLQGETEVLRDAVFCEGGRLPSELHCTEGHSPGAQDPDNLYWPRVSAQQENDGKHGKAVMCRTADWKYVRRLDEDDELYNLRRDPQEVVNLIHDPAAAAILSQLRERLLTWFQSTTDVVPFAANRR
jgi:arylsulfatase A-like enzyme